MKYHTFTFCIAITLSALFCIESGNAQEIIYQNNFDQHTSERLYTEADLDADWNTPDFNDGVDEGRVSIVGPAEAYGGTGHALAVSYPAGAHGTKGTGAQWKLELDGEYEELWLRYRVKFKTGFDFVRGGKLPGLAGGTAPTGNTTADGLNGWTGRMMWRTDFTGDSGDPQQLESDAISYAKYTDSGFNGDGQDEDKEYWLDANGDRVVIESGRWYEITQRVKMNEPGQADGVLQIWLDGELVHDQQDVLFRLADELKIDQLYISTFFGGNEDWKTSKDEIVYFDDFEVFRPEPRFIKVPAHYETIQEAIDAASPGDTVACRGRLRENVVVDKAIFLRGYTDTQLIALDRNAPAILVTSDDVRIKRFNTLYGSEGVLVAADQKNVVIESMRVRRSTSAGICLNDNCHGATLFKNHVYFCGGTGIVVSNSDSIQVDGNKCVRTFGTGFQFVNVKHSFFEGNSAVYNDGSGFEIDGFENDIVNNRSFLNGGIGVVVSGDENLVDDNYTLGNASHGFSFVYSANNQIRENLSIRDGGNGFEWLMMSDGNTVVDNISRFGDADGYCVDLSNGCVFDDNWSDDNRNGFVLTETTASNTVTRCRADDNQEYGFLDLGVGNDLNQNISRRNGND